MRRRDWWRWRGERRRHLTLERRRAGVCHTRLELELCDLPVDVVDRLVLGWRALSVTVRRTNRDLAELGRRGSSWRHCEFRSRGLS